MVFFNDPVEQPDHVQRAARMALAMRENVEALYQSWRLKGYEIHVGFGMHTGYATVGFVGYEGRLDYAVIGNVTNLAARLSDAAQGGEILISAGVRAELKNGFETESAGTLEWKEGSLYPSLHKLARDGLVRSEWSGEPGTRRRKYYHLTAAGRKALADKAHSWQQLAAAVERIVAKREGGTDG